MRTEYTDEFDAFNEAYVRERYLFDSGRKARLELEPAFDRYGYLFRPEEIEDLRTSEEEAFYDRDRKAIRFLREAAVGFELENAGRPLAEEIAAHTARSVVAWGGRDVPLRASGAAVASEPRPDARRALESRRASAFDETNDLRAERVERVREAVVALGAASVVALRSELSGVDRAEVAARARDLLSETERPFVESLEPTVVGLAGVRRGDATSADVARAFRFAELDRAFPTARLPVAYRDALAGLGIRTGAQPNVRLDLELRPTKIGRPFAAAIRVPDDVILVARPGGGIRDARAVLRAAGPAQQAAFTSPGTKVAFARAGDPAAPATYAILFENLMLDDDFLAELYPRARSAALSALARVERAYDVRRCAGLAIYQVWLHEGASLGGARERYVETLEEATGVRPSAAEYLADADLRLGATDELRALALEVQLRDRLKTRFGRRWWATRRAGDLLKELWSTGNEYTAEELAAELDLGPIAFDPLAEDVLGGLAR